MKRLHEISVVASVICSAMVLLTWGGSLFCYDVIPVAIAFQQHPFYRSLPVARDLRSDTSTTPLITPGSSPIRPCNVILYGSKDPYTIQILMSDTGGGHRASANALRDAFEEIYPNQIECDIVDVYTEYTPFPFNTAVQSYKIMAEYSFLWDWFYHFGASEFGLWLNELVLDIFCFEPFKECLSRPSGSTSKRADMILSVHPLTQTLPLKVLAYLDSDGKTRDPTVGRTKTPFITVVTDLGGAHPTWFDRHVDRCYVPSDALNKAAQARGLVPSQIYQLGLPIRRGFWGQNGEDESTASSKHEIREKLAMNVDATTVLVVGGGDGMGGIVPTATAIGQKLAEDAKAHNRPFQMVVVCGKNESAQKSLGSTEWGEDSNGNMKVIVNGFVNNMDEWMKASDVIVTKAGPGTIAEASICGLPCLLSSYLPGQEAGNIPFVEQNGFGTFKGEPDDIATEVSSWLESPQKLQEMQQAAIKASRPSATLDIAKSIADMLFEKVEKR